MSIDHLMRKAKGYPQLSNLILKEFTQGLKKFEL
jgi:hypothetical protein